MGRNAKIKQMRRVQRIHTNSNTPQMPLKPTGAFMRIMRRHAPWVIAVGSAAAIATGDLGRREIGRPELKPKSLISATKYESPFGGFRGPGAYIHEPDSGYFTNAAGTASREFADASSLWAKNAFSLLAATDPELAEKLKKEEIHIHFTDSGTINAIAGQKGNAMLSNYSKTPDFDAMTFTESQPNGGMMRHHILLDAKKIESSGDPRQVVPLMIHELAGNVPHMKGRIEAAVRANEAGRARISLNSEIQAHEAGIKAMENILTNSALHGIEGMERFHSVLKSAINRDKMYLRGWRNEK